MGEEDHVATVLCRHGWCASGVNRLIVCTESDGRVKLNWVAEKRGKET